MLTISVEHETDTAHRLSCHEGKCSNLHGHRYKFIVSIDVKGSIEDKAKFVDFYDLKKFVRDILDNLFDHAIVLKDCERNANLIKCLSDQNMKTLIFENEPTVEYMVQNLVKVFERANGGSILLRELTIYETPTNYCTWRKE